MRCASLIVAVASCARAAIIEPALPAASPWPVRERSGGLWPWRRRRVARSLTFYDDATCAFDDGEAGTWDCVADAVRVTTTVARADGGGRDTVRYHAMLHRNNFGDRPRLLRGVKSRDRRAPLPAAFLRVVLATFDGSGARGAPVPGAAASS